VRDFQLYGLYNFINSVVVDNFFGFENIRAVERKSGCLALLDKKCYNVIAE
jgi:hypothetical protein